jgi:uncharacterized protein YjgD (DUF1641 family)
MADAEKYAQWIVQNADKKGTADFETVVKAYQAARQQPESSVEVMSPEGDLLKPSFGETGGGAALGRPINRGQLNVQPEPRPLESALAGATKSVIDPLLAGAQLATGNNPSVNDLTQKIAQEASQYKEANPKSYVAGRIGGAFLPAAGMSNIGMIPSFAKLPQVVQNIGIGATQGLLTPEETGKTGAEFYGNQARQATIGGATGGILSPVMEKLSALLRGPEQSKQMVGAVEKAREAGYVVPPTQAKESLVNRVLEGTAGKVTTAQNASAKNQEITHKLVSKSLGLPEDEVIVPQVLKDIRKEAGTVYDEISKLPVKPQVLPSSVMNRPGEAEIDPAKMVQDLKIIRRNADGYYEAYKRSAHPEDLAKAQQAKSAATNIENTLENYAQSLGRDDLLPALRDARQLYAKTYTIEKALNPVSGTVDARVLARELKKGKPLSEELKTVAEFASQFPKASQVTETMGSRPQISPTDMGVAGIMSAMTDPSAMSALLVRPTARAAALSDVVQNNLIQGQITPEQANLAKLLMLKGVVQATSGKGKENE